VLAEVAEQEGKRKRKKEHGEKYEIRKTYKITEKRKR
jgi:hypothetical protein